VNPYIRAFFNATAGLEKFIIGVLGALAVFVPESGYFDDPQGKLLVATIIAFQMLYTSNTAPVPAKPTETHRNPPADDERLPDMLK
jgi:hypothetical protein